MQLGEQTNTKASTTPVAALNASDILTLNSSTGKIMKGNKEYYGCGVNYYDAFYRVVIDPKHTDTSYKAGIKTLSENKVPFIRFSILGYYPDDFKYYKNSEADYFAKLDEFIAYAEENHIGLIPSFFWDCSAVSDYVGEKVGGWGDLNNTGVKTNAFISEYIQKIVNRYGKNKAIWAWEFGNEANIATCPAKKTFQEESWVYPNHSGVKGFPTTRTYQDTLHTKQLNLAFDQFKNLIRKNESSNNLPNRIIFSGNTTPSWGALSRYYGKWAGNNKAELETAMVLQNGNLGTITIHPYPGDPEAS